MKNRTIAAISTSLGVLAGWGIAKTLNTRDSVPYTVLGGLVGTLAGEIIIEQKEKGLFLPPPKPN